jgi:hypothetical protein
MDWNQVNIKKKGIMEEYINIEEMRKNRRPSFDGEREREDDVKS